MVGLTLLICLLIAGGFCLFSFNRLKALKNRCVQALADVDVQLKQRHDLIPSLVETVRGYVGHEKDVLEAVTSARAEALSAVGMDQNMRAEAALGAHLARLLSIAETNPDLKASQHFESLRSEISDVENKIAASRRFLNLTASEYNTALEQFPGQLFASWSGLRQQKFFDLGDDRVFIEDAPVVKF